MLCPQHRNSPALQARERQCAARTPSAHPRIARRSLGQLLLHCLAAIARALDRLLHVSRGSASLLGLVVDFVCLAAGDRDKTGQMLAEQDKRTIVGLEPSAWDAWLHSTNEHAAVLIQLPPPDLYQHAAADPEKQVTLI
jgi:hypothetical protein